MPYVSSDISNSIDSIDGLKDPIEVRNIKDVMDQSEDLLVEVTSFAGMQSVGIPLPGAGELDKLFIVEISIRCDKVAF
eukprot:CAMPEP_0197262640 /NCGR_PEP_ID=MMETSP1432-20130617/605_1 /TAXON_ID=44447 /ORGANISM="Pseudo-nitzschia delicatissima, Strain UNC1205" /LENGTH=77 /DNA_ID=CAMNT_0042726947 /DNA_START=194 /DNA_END=427 /DNA_ORIENTATION=+